MDCRLRKGRAAQIVSGSGSFLEEEEMTASSQNSGIKVTPRLMDVKEVAMLLGISARTVWTMVADGSLPQPVRLGRRKNGRGRCTRWRAADLERLIDNLR